MFFFIPQIRSTKVIKLLLLLYLQCLGWSWYLANDMQFYIISPAILYTVYWYVKFY